MKILMVCLGNICRSPLAEGIMKQKVSERGLGWQVDSAGTGRWHIGSKPDSRSMAVAAKYGMDISDQRGRQINGYDMEQFDLIFAMDSGNYNDILRLAQNESERQKVRLILNESRPGMNQAVPDPYWNDNGFEEVYQLLDEACEAFLNKELKQGKI